MSLLHLGSQKAERLKKYDSMRPEELLEIVKGHVDRNQQFLTTKTELKQLIGGLKTIII